MDSNAERPEPTPEGTLIRRTREAATPKLSIRAAAARIGMSAEQWGYVERGYTPGRDGSPPQPFSPPAATLARMARALQLPARALGDAGRHDAAELLDYSPAHYRTPSVAQASEDIGQVLINLQREHGLTDAEMLLAVFAWERGKVEDMLRAERHSGDPSKSADEE